MTKLQIKNTLENKLIATNDNSKQDLGSLFD